MPLPAKAILKVAAWGGFAGTSGMVNPSRDLVLLGNLNLTKLSDSSAVTLGACIGRPAWNGSGAPAGVQYRPVMEFPSVSQSLAEGGEPSYAAPLTWGDLVLWNGDGWFSGGNPDGINYLDKTAYSWDSVDFLLGVSPDAYSDFDSLPGYRFSDRPDVGPHHIRLRSGTAIIDPRQPAYDEKLAGWDCALNNDDGSLHAVLARDLNVAATEDWHLSLRFKIASGSGAAHVLFDTRDAVTGSAGTAGLIIFGDATDQLYARYDDGANIVSSVIGSAGEFHDGAWHGLQTVGDRATGLAKVYVDQSEVDSDDISALGAITNENDSKIFEQINGTSPSTCEVDEVKFRTGFGIAPTADERKATDEAPSSASEPGVLVVYHCDEDTGTTLNNAYEPTLEGVVDPPIHEFPGNRCIRGTGGANEEVAFGDTLDMDATTDYTIAVRVRVHTKNNGALVSKKTTDAAGQAGYSMIVLAATGGVRMRVSDGANQATVLSATDYADGVGRWLIMRVDRSGALGTADTIYATISDSAGRTLTALGTADLSSVGSPANAETRYLGRLGGGTFPLNGEISGYWHATEAIPDADLVRILPNLAEATEVDGLVSAYHFDKADETSGAGGTLSDQYGSNDGTIGSSVVFANRNGTITPATAANGGWVSTLTGSPVNGTAGVYRQQLYGEFAGVAGIRVDHRGHDHTAIGGFADCIVEELHHGPDDLAGIDSATEGGVAATLTTHYKISSDGKLAFWDVSAAAPVGALRYNGRGAKFGAGTTYVDRLGPMLREIANTNGHATTGEMPATTEFNAEFPYSCAVVIRGGERTAESIGQVMQRALIGDTRDPGGLYWATDLESAGVYLGHSTVDPDDFDADVTLDDSSISLDGIASGDSVRRVHSVSVGYARQWHKLSDSEIAQGTTTTNRVRFAREFSYATVTSSTVAKADGRAIVVESPLVQHADALIWAQHLLTMLDGGWSIKVTPVRYLWQAHLIRSGRARPDVVSVESAHYEGVSSAVKFLLIGYENIPPTAGRPLSVRWVLWRPA